MRIFLSLAVVTLVFGLPFRHGALNPVQLNVDPGSVKISDLEKKGHLIVGSEEISIKSADPEDPKIHNYVKLSDLEKKGHLIVGSEEMTMKSADPDDPKIHNYVKISDLEKKGHLIVGTELMQNESADPDDPKFHNYVKISDLEKKGHLIVGSEQMAVQSADPDDPKIHNSVKISDLEKKGHLIVGSEQMQVQSADPDDPKVHNYVKISDLEKKGHLIVGSEEMSIKSADPDDPTVHNYVKISDLEKKGHLIVGSELMQVQSADPDDPKVHNYVKISDLEKKGHLIVGSEQMQIQSADPDDPKIHHYVKLSDLEAKGHIIVGSDLAATEQSLLDNRKATSDSVTASALEKNGHILLTGDLLRMAEKKVQYMATNQVNDAPAGYVPDTKEDRTFTSGNPDQYAINSRSGDFNWKTPCDCPHTYTKASAEPSECAHCGKGSSEGALLQFREAPAGYVPDTKEDRTFTSGDPDQYAINSRSGDFSWKTPCDCPHTYTKASAEPSECAHCGKGSAEGALLQVREAPAGYVPDTKEDRTFTSGNPDQYGINSRSGDFSWKTPCDCPHTYTKASAEPSECAHCGNGSAEGTK